MQDILNYILDFKGAFFTVITLILVYSITKKILDRQIMGKNDSSVIRSVILFSIMLIGIIAIILALPMDDSIRGQITSLMGIVISAVLALSSATFIGNGLAGIMLRSINSFRPGDFIRVNEYFGRISERGLFHTEIQTENRDLTTIPNLYLATNPVKVTRSSGTFISGVCSLGYDVNRQVIEKALLKAAEDAGLEDSFVRITELGDFSVVYKTYGLVKDIKTILSAQSRLNAMILDALHAANIEIVSPNFMNQRQVGETVFIPKKVRAKEQIPVSDAPEDKIFDKAEEAESIEKSKERVEDVDAKIKELNEALAKATDETAKAEIKKKLERWKNVKEKMVQKIDTKLDEISSKK